MAAVMKVFEMTATIVGVDKTASTVRFKLAHDATIDSNDPITIPASGGAHTVSFDKKLRLFCATAPSVQIDNLKFYSDGTGFTGDGITVNASNVGVTYLAASRTAIVGGKNLFDFKTSGSAEMAINVTDTADITATGFGGDMVALQMEVAASAVPGALTDETVTFSYDEI